MLIGKKIAEYTYDFWITKDLGLANEVFILEKVLFFKVCYTKLDDQGLQKDIW